MSIHYGKRWQQDQTTDRPNRLAAFVEKGVTATTIKDIAGTARIAEGTIYRHYTSKAELAWELFAKNMVALAHELDRSQQPHQSLREKLTAIINYVCSFHDSVPIALSLPPPRPSRPYPQYDPRHAQPGQGAKHAIAQRMAAGEIPESTAIS